MSKKPQIVSVTILNKEYKIACPPEEQEALLHTAYQLNAKMRKLHDSGKVTGTDRVAVMAALNLAHELEMAKPAGTTYQAEAMCGSDSSSSASANEITKKIINLRHKIENALENS